MSPDIAASVKARLLARAKQRGEEFELFLVRYACERFLYRLGASAFRDRCVLKGAGLLTLWMGDPYRATRDVDLLAFGPTDAASVREVVATICSVPCPADGLTFDLDSLDVSPIRVEDEYQGQRAVLRAHLGTARIRLQIDLGFGDAVTPGPEDAEYPTLLEGLPVPWLRTYPRVVTVAEKFEAMVRFGRLNSRMKDFHDIWALSSEFEFRGAALRQAVSACFDRRGTAWTPETPDVLGIPFYSARELQGRWMAYTRGTVFRKRPPIGFEPIGNRVREFLGPVRESIVTGEGFERHWGPDGPWA
jgi:predicted nucleotidyltransferase component of viral defense system